MKLKKFIAISAALSITVASLLLLTSPLWIGWIMEHEHNKTKVATADISLPCKDGASEKRAVWSKLGIAIFCEKQGNKHGPWQAWDGGYMHISGEYVEGRKHGIWKYFNANGEQWGERKYSKGEVVSILENLLVADSVLVEKKERKLYLIQNGNIYRTYNIRLGSEPSGHKQQPDDQRTPEGQYVLDFRDEDSGYYKSFHISYPNRTEQKHAAQNKLNLDNKLFIHGQPNGFGWAWRVFSLWDWTDGSIAVNNQDMDEILSLVKDGTPIKIIP